MGPLIEAGVGVDEVEGVVEGVGMGVVGADAALELASVTIYTSLKPLKPLRRAPKPLCQVINLQFPPNSRCKVIITKLSEKHRNKAFFPHC